MKIKIVACLVFAFLLYILWAADSGHFPGLVASLYAFPYGDKVGHFGLYGLIALFLALAFPRVCHGKRFRIPIIIVAFLIFSVAEEWSQSFFYRRTPDLIDAVCSCTGILFGTWVAYRWKNRLGLLL